MNTKDSCIINRQFRQCIYYFGFSLVFYSCKINIYFSLFITTSTRIALDILFLSWWYVRYPYVRLISYFLTSLNHLNLSLDIFYRCVQPLCLEMFEWFIFVISKIVFHFSTIGNFHLGKFYIQSHVSLFFIICLQLITTSLAFYESGMNDNVCSGKIWTKINWSVIT